MKGRAFAGPSLSCPFLAKTNADANLNPRSQLPEGSSVSIPLCFAGLYRCLYVEFRSSNEYIEPDRTRTGPDLYMLDPPPGAKHSPISPSQIILAG